MQAVIVCVDYADLLAITLPYNRYQFTDVIVVTTPADVTTVEVAVTNGCRVLQTDIFYAGGKLFNKFAAMEQALDALQPSTWLCFLDADIMLPKDCIRERQLWKSKIYSPFRRMWDDVTQPPPPEAEWGSLRYGEPTRATLFAGYMQMFHVQDPVLGPRPWHSLDYDNASDGDTAFSRKWATKNKVRPAFDVLHLGQDTKNWCGRATQYVDGTLPPAAASREAAVQTFLSKRKARAK